MTAGRRREHEGRGTRFRLYPQSSFLAGYREPITVELSCPAGTVGLGPSDLRMAVIQPVGKTSSYGQLLLQSHGRALLPPWRGPVAAPASPGPGGHFDHIPPDDPAFLQAHAFACVRFALDVWEGYLGREIPWYFARTQRWLEIGLLSQAYDNGEVGWGWLELGYDRATDRLRQPYALNFDVIAHEVGHLIVYGTLGQPGGAGASAEYAGFHEAAADLVALLAAAHLQPVVDQVLDRTRGNLYVANELNRLGELSSTTQIRIASNSVRMEEFALGWSDEHDLSEPLTGAIFDLLLDIYQAHLVERGLVPPSLVAMAEEVGHLRAFASTIQAEFDRWYPRAPREFSLAFADARDRLGSWLAFVFLNLRRDQVTYVAVRDALLEVDRRAGGRFGPAIIANFDWRRIGTVAIGPFLGSRSLAAASMHLGLHRCARREVIGLTSQISKQG